MEIEITEKLQAQTVKDPQFEMKGTKQIEAMRMWTNLALRYGAEVISQAVDNLNKETNSLDRRTWNLLSR